jgi:serine/threonine-protein kinase
MTTGSQPERRSRPVAGVGVGAVLAGRYLLEGTLASGGMGALFRGRDEVLDRPVAVKVLHPHLAETDAAARFLREGRVLGSLMHPNLATIFDMDSEGGLPYLVMEFVEGESLAEVIDRDAPVSRPAGMPIALQLCRGLAYMHERGVVHRDIKPQNILITKGDRVRIVDFGIARGPEAAEMTAPGWVMGTAQYLAPEIVAGEAATPRSDLYALGVVLYRLFTARLPFEGDDPFAVALQHRTAPVPPPTQFVPDMPPALAEVLLRLLEKEPRDRYQTASAVGAALAGAGRR